VTEGSGGKRSPVGEDEPQSDERAVHSPHPLQSDEPAPVLVEDDKCHFDSLPDELLDGAVVDALGLQDLCAFAQVCKKFRSVAKKDCRWRAFFESRWGAPNATVEKAAKLAGSWRQLYAAKQVVEQESQPWVKPTSFEVAAAVEGIAVRALGLPESDSAVKDAPVETDVTSRSVLFLVDGSGSVTEDDFNNMTSFMQQAWHGISSVCASAKVGIVQFSNDVKVELQPAAMNSEGFQTHVAKMSRMNGGTNISAAIRKAGQLLGGTKGEGGHSAIVLLTDGRVDGYQASEAVEMAGRLVDEVSGQVSLYAFGVGRGVDKAELLRIVGAGGPAPDDSHYLGLCTYEDAPW